MPTTKRATASGASTPRLLDHLPPLPPAAQTLAEHARFVLAAEFDIDSGATIRHQFPFPVTPAGSHFLAELMLPDGAHLHKDDTTVFYLNQVPGNAVSDGLLSEDERSASDDDAGEVRRPPRPPQADKEVLYVLNCVSLKENQAVRRGAEVKALAVCFPHPFIQAYKPLIILALQHYFASPSVAVLSDLFDAINAVDTAGMPRFSPWEKAVLRATDRRDLFAEVFRDPRRKGLAPAALTAPSAASAADEAEPAPPSPFEPDPPAPAGWLSTSSSASSLSLPPVPPSKSIPSSLDLFPDQPPQPAQRGRVGSASAAHHKHGAGALNGSFGGDGAGRQRDTHVFETSARLEGTLLPMSIPLATFHEEVGEYSLKELIRKFSPSTAPAFPGPHIPSLHTSGASTPPLILLLNALLTSRRVLFLGHNKPAGDVAAFVLAACALVSGSGAVLRGFVRRAFPYTNLMGLDVLEQVEDQAEGGWVAGVTNPRFEDLQSRWDILCNIDSGRITVSRECRGERVDARAADDAKASDVSLARSSGASAPPPSQQQPAVDELGEFGGLDAAVAGSVRGKGGRSDSVGTGKAGAGLGGDQDAIFMDEITSLIDRHYSEAVVRTRVAEYLQHFVHLTARYEDETYPAAAAAPGARRVWFPTAACDPAKGTLGSGAILWEGEAAATTAAAVANDGGASLGPAAAAADKRRRESDAAAGGGGLDGRRTVAEWVGPAGVRRIEAWRGTQSCELCKDDFAEFRRTTTLSFDLPHQLARLRSARSIPEREAVAIFHAFAAEVRSYEQVVEVLAHTPMNRGGLTPFGFGLFHHNHEIKAATVDFFDSLQQYPIGVAFLLSLNGFHRLAYKRLSDERTSAVCAQVDQARRAHALNPAPAPAGVEKTVGLGMNGAGL